jgi:hypothetical protein
MNNKFFFLIVILALSAVFGTGCNAEGHDNLVEISRERQCRANMNTLCTDMANIRDAIGYWIDDQDEIDEYARRSRPLVCPVTGEAYTIDLKEDGYVISCPCGHGSIDTGRRSWTGD